VTYKLLIVEDDQDAADVVAFAVRMNWPNCEVMRATEGSEALRLFDTEHPDMAVLDINVPPPNGFQICLHIRETSQIPVLVLTARHATLDKIRALDLGADDYLTKPFDHLELLARLRAISRRTDKWTGQEQGEGKGATPTGQASPHGMAAMPLEPAEDERKAGASAQRAAQGATMGDISINYDTREVRVKGNVLTLTTTEYRLLEELMRHAGSVLPHSYLLERVWGPEYSSEYHYLKVFVRRLRSKLGDDASHPRYIQTEWGTGYRFVPS